MGLTYNGGNFGLEPVLWDKLSMMIAASHGAIRIGNGRRTNAEQTKLYAQKPGLAAPPGKSNHEYGLAADLEGDMALAHRLAPMYGLFFPMAHEPWHIEAVGVNRKTYAGQADNASYTPGPAGELPAEGPDLHSLGVQLVSAFGMLGGGGDGVMGEVTDPTLAEPTVGSVLGLPGQALGDPVTSPPNTQANPEAYAEAAPEEQRDTLLNEQERTGSKAKS